jgi:hypothetical protein
VDLRHLVEDPHALAALGRVLDGELDAAHGVLDVDERARLAAGAVTVSGWPIAACMRKRLSTVP